MSVYKNYFPFGLGTARFPVSGLDDTAGLEKSIKIVLRALDAGVNYIDIGYTYLAGMAMQVLKEAFRQTSHSFSTTAKVVYNQDKTCDDVRRRVEFYLKGMELEHIKFFTCWCIWSYEDFLNIMQKGGIYEGALKLKEEGVIEHICCSLHAPPAEMIQIIESGAFEGVTVPFSLVNAGQMLPVLDTAKERGIGVAVMNPLGGGLIAQNRDYFSFACMDGDDGDTVHAALRFVKAHPAVDIVLGGVSSEEELSDSLSVFTEPDLEPPKKRIDWVMKKASDLKGFCTGCKYCAGCPQGIPTYELMQARNALLFAPAASYNRQGPEELLYNLQIFRKLQFDGNQLPVSEENPCVQCGRCNTACTQKLDVIQGVANVYQRAGVVGYTQKARKERLWELLHGKGYRRVGLYPNSSCSSKIMELYQSTFGAPEFEWLLFNSDTRQRGLLADGIVIHNPDEIPSLQLDMILICSYRSEKAIAETLKPYMEQGIIVKSLYREQEVPWVF